MKLNKWLDDKIPGVAQSLDELNRKHFFSEKTIGFAGKESVYSVLKNFRSSLFPGVYEKYPIDETWADVIIGNSIRTGAMELCNLLRKTYANKCEKENPKHEDCLKCLEIAEDIVIELVDKLPAIREKLQTDIQAAYDGDPAAVNKEEIILSYPFLDAISIHSIAHELYKLNVPVIPRIMTEYAHQRTGIDIHPGAQIGDYFFIDHGTGVVIGETCTIGNHVKLYQGVTLGAKSFPLDEHGNPIKGIKRHPDIEDNVIIYAGATILGGDTVIGHDSVIGGNVFLMHSVPPFTTVYNSQPSPVVKQNPSV